jgi:hypothetical protein
VSIPPFHQDFLTYYRGLMAEAGGQVPKRSDVRPSDMKTMLPWVVMGERSGPRQMIPTVIGSAIDEVLHASFTGINLFDFLPEEIAVRLDAYYSNITDTPCGGYVERTLASDSGLLKGYQTTLFPLVGAEGKVDRLIGIVSVMKTDPLMDHFGKPRDVQTVAITKEEYIDIGFGVPASV